MANEDVSLKNPKTIKLIMNTGIEIKFYEIDKPEEEKIGVLYINENGRHYIEFKGSWLDSIRVIKTIFATQIRHKEKYTLINCYFRQAIDNNCRFIINELYKGEHLKKVDEIDCKEVSAQMTGLTNWLNHPRIIPEISFSSVEQSKVVIKELFKTIFKISETLSLELCEFCGGNYERNKSTLQNVSYVRFQSEALISRLELYKNTTAFLNLLSIFTDEIPKLFKLDFSFANEKTTEYLIAKEIVRDYENDAILTYDKLEPFLQEMFVIFFSHRDKYVKVINLLTSSIENSTAEISFLNITTAFEVFHKYFYEDNNEVTRKKLIEELIEGNIISARPRKWDQIIRYYHLFKLVDDIDFFKQNSRNIFKTISLLRNSRNYYTHYSKIVGDIWTPNKLLYMNKELRQLLKAVILKSLNLPNELINKLSTNNAAIFYHDYETNEFSINYLTNDNPN